MGTEPDLRQIIRDLEQQETQYTRLIRTTQAELEKLQKALGGPTNIDGQIWTKKTRAQQMKVKGYYIRELANMRKELKAHQSHLAHARTALKKQL